MSVPNVCCQRKISGIFVVIQVPLEKSCFKVTIPLEFGPSSLFLQTTDSISMDGCMFRFLWLPICVTCLHHIVKNNLLSKTGLPGSHRITQNMVNIPYAILSPFPCIESELLKFITWRNKALVVTHWTINKISGKLTQCQPVNLNSQGWGCP